MNVRRNIESFDKHLGLKSDQKLLTLKEEEFRTVSELYPLIVALKKKKRSDFGVNKLDLK